MKDERRKKKKHFHAPCRGSRRCHPMCWRSDSHPCCSRRWRKSRQWHFRYGCSHQLAGWASARYRVDCHRYHPSAQSWQACSAWIKEYTISPLEYNWKWVHVRTQHVPFWHLLYETHVRRNLCMCVEDCGVICWMDSFSNREPSIYSRATRPLRVEKHNQSLSLRLLQAAMEIILYEQILIGARTLVKTWRF